MGDKMKLNIKKISKIICIMILLIALFMPSTEVFARINPDTIDTSWSSGIKGFLGKMLEIGTGPLTAAIASLINVVIGIVFLVLSFVFAPIANGFLFPFPDQIIFNKVPFFDPNFINPTISAMTENSPVVILQSLIKNLYYTCFVMAGAVFVIAAMVIGIKLAISTIATEKAHYKQALMTWITGLFLLFTTHFIMLIIFTVNEEIVTTVSRASDNIGFDLDLLQIIPLGIGKALSTIVNGIAGLLGADSSVTDITVYGYGGLLIKFAAYAFGGDLPSSIVCAILLGQTVALIVMYIKRLFYSIILGMIAPLIVAADVMKKTM